MRWSRGPRPRNPSSPKPEQITPTPLPVLTPVKASPSHSGKFEGDKHGGGAMAQFPGNTGVRPALFPTPRIECPQAPLVAPCLALGAALDALGPLPREALEALVSYGLSDADIARYLRVLPEAVGLLRMLWDIAPGDESLP